MMRSIQQADLVTQAIVFALYRIKASAQGFEFLDVAQAHGETEVEPDRIPDNILRKTVPLEGYLSHSLRLTNGERFALD